MATRFPPLFAGVNCANKEPSRAHSGPSISNRDSFGASETPPARAAVSAFAISASQKFSVGCQSGRFCEYSPFNISRALLN
jgi:hypothetical protein